MSMIIRLEVIKKCRIKFLTLMYIAVNFMVSQITAIPQDLVLTLTESQPTQEVPLDVKFHRNITLVPGHSYEINCNHKMGGFGGQSNVTVWFHFNDTPVQQLLATPVNMSVTVVHAIEVDKNNWKLVLQPFQETDSGVYTCRAASSSVSLDIRPGNPTILSSTPELRFHHGVQRGSRPTLIAFVSGTPQPNRSNITWYFNDQSLPTSILQEGKELILPSNIEFGLAGRYTCQVTTSAGTASDDFLVTIIRQPVVSLDGQRVVASDSAAVLICSDIAGVPTPLFNWTYADNPYRIITTDDRIMIMNDNTRYPSSLLIIDPVLPCDSGWYTCTAFNDAGHSSQRICVEVHFKPILKPYTSSAQARVVEGSNATLQTLLVDANPMDITSIRWLRPSRDVIPHTQYSSINTSNGTVYTVTLTPSSGGVYTCEVENSIGISTVNFTLIVIVPPTLSHSDGSTEVRTVITRSGGQQVTLTAHVLQFGFFGNMSPVVDEEIDISWNRSDFGQERRIHDDSVKYNITSSDDLSLLNLTIISPTIEDSGLYTITITNKAGTVSLYFQLEVLDPPAPPIMLNATSIALCAIEVKWTLPDHPPNNTAAPAYILIEASLSGSTEWTEIGYSTVNTTESKMNFPLIGVFNGTNTVNELYLRARSGNDIGNIGVGEYYTENTTFSFFSEVPDPPIGLRETESSNETTVLQWRAPYNCTILHEAPSTCDSILYLITCQSGGLTRVKVSGNKTCATVTLRKGERYKCSVQAQNRCKLLSNHSDSIEVYVPADDVTVTGKINTTVIIAVVFTVVAVLILLLSITAVCCALFLQHSRSKLNVPSLTTSIQWEKTESVHSASNDLYTADNVTDDAIAYSTLKEACIQLVDFRAGLPTGGWDREEQEKDNEL